jgi:GNAT superfamily N-acetyltransferase
MATCPVFTFKIDRDASGGGFQIRAQVPERLGPLTMGVIEVEPDDQDGRLRVAWIRTEDSVRRCGLGTKLYERAAVEACRSRRVLTSDITRSESSDGFWQKQVKKGRATCKAIPAELTHLKTVARFSAPGEKIAGRSNCWFYKLKSCKVAAELSGTRRRR